MKRHIDRWTPAWPPEPISFLAAALLFAAASIAIAALIAWITA